MNVLLMRMPEYLLAQSDEAYAETGYVRAGYSGLEELLGPEGVEELRSQDREGQRHATAQGKPFPEEAFDEVIRKLESGATLPRGG